MKSYSSGYSDMEALKLILIVGPTASGKTAASIYAAIKLNGEIVSADSIQVYKGMDIGSAKPTMQERQGIPHHLMDAIDINSPKFSVAEFRKMAGEAIEDIAGRGKQPIVVGGTGLYINSLVFPLNFTEVQSDEKLRSELSEIEERQGRGTLHAMLQEEDPESAARLHPNDTKRIIRALEVLRLTGKPIDAHGGDFSNKAGAEIPYNPVMIGLLEQGLVEEARAIYDRNYDRSLPALQGLGYKQLFRVFDGEYTLSEGIEAIKQETRRFAKRQLTWFRRDRRITWLDVSTFESAEALGEEVCRICTRGM